MTRLSDSQLLIDQGRRIGWQEAIETIQNEHDYARKYQGHLEQRQWELAVRALMEKQP